MELENFGLITDLDKAKPVYDRILFLSNEKIKILERMADLRKIGNHKEAQSLQLNVSKINIEIGALKESIEYVRTKMFITVAKSYLTKQQMNEINIRCEEILSSPEIYLLR